MENNESALRREGAFMGLSLGVLVVVLTILPMYYYASSSSFWTVIIGPVITGFLFPLVIAILFTFRLRKKIGGYWSFKQAVVSIFMMLLVAAAISSFTGFVFEKYVEPEMRERYMRNIANNSIEFMERSGADAEQIDAQIEKIDEQIAQAGEVNITNTLRGLGISIIVVFVLALIFAALFKKERPIFQSSDNDPIDQQ
ncbi:DUF4199 domain-containing protein [Olivibacter sp. SDN3]|uniref:DUF4199 domain-containing protein n=1 Tax=Olivibacter sp. SDN3 TaxID=2764720 RepID=UPI0016518AE6|nr:DUF4199 domain-containing protein [Olivibacter sp. SDN3]QNL49934.1 DUF4199 domain-containing protein [Olivibacter sp. SDN3]